MRVVEGKRPASAKALDEFGQRGVEPSERIEASQVGDPLLDYPVGFSLKHREREDGIERTQREALDDLDSRIVGGALPGEAACARVELNSDDVRGRQAAA